MRRLWERMAAIYPNQWRAAMGESPQHPVGSPKAGQLTVYGDTWARALASLSPEQIGRGLSRCAARPGGWIPKPGDFLVMCLGLPNVAQVGDELRVKNGERSPFAVMVGQQLDWHRWRHASASEGDRMLAAAYERAVLDVISGKPMPEPVLLVEHNPGPHMVIDRDGARSAMERAARELGVGHEQ